MTVQIENRFSDVELCEMFNISIGAGMIAQGRKTGDEELIRRGERVTTTLWYSRPRNRAGDNADVKQLVSARDKMGHPGVFSIKKNPDGTHDIIVQKTGIGCDKEFRAARVAQLAQAYSERMNSEESPFSSPEFSELEA